MGPEPDWVAMLPAVNATLNGLATVLLVCGFLAIRKGNRDTHRKIMLSAFFTSVLFLACYLVYHFALHHYTGSGSKKFPADHAGRPVYLAILLTHVILATAVPVLAAITIYRGLKQDWVRHKRIAKITFPIWLYVSVTGVIIYFMLYHWARA
jgi:protein SCO1